MDNFLLNGPNGSSLNVASFVLDGVDFGEQDLLKAAFSENPAAEGAVLAFETVNHRTMTFPVRVASTSAFSGALGLQAWLRTLARPGATLDIQLDGVPSTEAVRFDVLAGRFETSVWNTKMYSQTDRFEGTLKLDTQPYGYWPTTILLASSASVGLPGTLAIPAASIIGDAPGLARIMVAPSTPTNYPLGTWRADVLGWSLGARPSFQAFLAPGSLIGNLNPSLAGDPFALSSQAAVVQTNAGAFAGSWNSQWTYTISAGLEPAYRGRYRFFTWMKLTPSQALPVQVAADAIGAAITQGNLALASAGPVATLAPAVASGSPGAFGFAPSPAYTLLDLGEVTLPAVACYPSGAQTNLRLFVNWPSQTGTTTVSCGGLYLLPLEMAGVMPGGLTVPTIAAPNAAAFALDFDAINGRTNFAVSPADSTPAGNILALYRGLRPMVGASTIQLDLVGAARRATSGATGPVANTAPLYAACSVQYRPRFAFVKGI